MSKYFARRRQIFDKQRNNPERRENLLELNEAAQAFKKANDELNAAQQIPFSEDSDLYLLPPTLIPSTLRDRASKRIRTIGERMKG